MQFDEFKQNGLKFLGTMCGQYIGLGLEIPLKINILAGHNSGHLEEGDSCLYLDVFLL